MDDHQGAHAFGSDYETDAIIQTSLRQGLGKDVTLFTIVHRLQTIMDADKIVGVVLPCEL